jgi:succinate dehydrogenase/fumarate reductase flavoprotein subunit
MAGLVAAARAVELGARPVVLEKTSRPGGSMLLSSGVVWRYRDLETFRRECPGGDPALQALVVERLDADLRWLERLGARVLDRETGNPRTVGVRFDVRDLTAALAAAAGGLCVRRPIMELPADRPVILATGGFQGSRDLVRRHITPQAEHLWIRANPASTGAGFELGLEAGAATSSGLDEFYGRNLPAFPAKVTPAEFAPLAQLYARYARVEADDGETYPAERVAWHESDVAQWVARRPGASAWYCVHRAVLIAVAGGRRVGDQIAAARNAGGRIEERGEEIAVRVTAGITSTLGGLFVDTDMAVLDTAGRPLEQVYAAGTDAGGVSTGGYSSGLAAALVLGRIAAERVLGVGGDPSSEA